jgi:hypothetical protein
MAFKGLNEFFLFNIKIFDEVKTKFKRLKQSLLKAYCHLWRVLKVSRIFVARRKSSLQGLRYSLNHDHLIAY